QFIADGNTFRSLPVTPPIDQSGFNVPESGFSVDGKLYVFFWTDHHCISAPTICETADDEQKTFRKGYSVLALARGPDYSDSVGRDLNQVDFGRTVLKDGYEYHPFSTDNFIYTAPVVVNNADWPDLPMHTGKGLLLWGTDTYRGASADGTGGYLHLAFVPLDSVTTRSEWRVLTGRDANVKPTWDRFWDAKGKKTKTMPLF